MLTPKKVDSCRMEEIRRCKDSLQAEDEIEHLNHTSLIIGGRTFTPVEGLVGLLAELADCYYRHYIDTMPWWEIGVRVLFPSMRIGKPPRRISLSTAIRFLQSLDGNEH